MEEYIGKICPYCKTEIKEGDRVKVCPECGIPHHASCWEKNLGCTTFGCGEQRSVEPPAVPGRTCANCGAPLEAGQAFCTRCGAKSDGSSPDGDKTSLQLGRNPGNPEKAPCPASGNQQMAAPSVTGAKVSACLSIGGILSGILSVIFGFVMLGKNVGYSESSSVYGGDAYTGIQNAAAQTANNVKKLSEITRDGFAFFLIAVGLVSIFSFAARLWKIHSENNFALSHYKGKNG